MKSYRQMYGRLATAAARVAFAATLVLVGAPILHAQEEGGSEEQSPRAELQQVQRQLMSIRQQALQEKPELQEEQQALQETIVAAMRDVDPEADQKTERMNEIQSEMQAAQQDGDQETAQELLMEMQQIQQQLQQIQSQAMQKPEVQEAYTAFRDELYAAMREVDPQAEELMNRAQELRAQIQGGSPPGR